MYTSIAQAPIVDTSGWDFCPRMSLRAPRLLCGEREECKGCEKLDAERETGDRYCRFCGKLFPAIRKNQKYCSSHCRKQANNLGGKHA